MLLPYSFSFMSYMHSLLYGCFQFLLVFKNSLASVEGLVLFLWEPREAKHHLTAVKFPQLLVLLLSYALEKYVYLMFYHHLIVVLEALQAMDDCIL